MRVLTEIDRDALGQLIARDELFWLDVTAPTAEGLERLRHELGSRFPPIGMLVLWFRRSGYV
ncbi:hypothetical protein BH20ACT18_BH20ACT18_00760 [soil metagenome]